MDNLLGKLLDNRYLVEELLGIGGMAKVYKGFDVTENRSVAIKMLKDEYVTDDTFIRRFINESKAISTLNHPYIVKIYDVILSEKNPAIIMEYVDGVTLKDYIEKKGKLSRRSATVLIAQLLTALDNAHENGVVHCDIKPQNITVSPSGSIKVMDFGIAKLAMSEAGIKSDNAVGSVHYISPEQAKGGRSLDPRTDIYSTGVILYEMLTGKLPYDDESPVNIARKHVQGGFPLPCSIDQSISQGLQDIIVKAMAKDPDNRYQTAKEMLRDLEKISEDPDATFGYTQKELAYRKQPPAKSGSSNTSGSASSKHPSSQNEKSRIPFAIGKTKEKSDRDTGSRNSKLKKLADKFMKSSPFMKLVGITAIVAILTLLILIVFLIIAKPFSKVPEVDMPSLLGKNIDDVLADRAYSDFEIEIVERSANTLVDSNCIYEQYPTSGKRVNVGTKVKVKVSLGSETFPMPDITNKEAAIAYTQLKEAGLEYTIEEEYSSTVAEGFVIRTDPVADTGVATGYNVTVYVSSGSGKQKVTVPSLVGHDIEEAKEIAAQNNFILSVKYEPNNNYPAGQVFSQSPGYPATAEIGSTIYVSVSEGNSSPEKSQSIFVSIPDEYDGVYLLTVKLDGYTAYTETIDISSLDSKVISLTLNGSNTQRAEIYLDNNIIQTLLIDFENGSYSEL